LINPLLLDEDTTISIPIYPLLPNTSHIMAPKIFATGTTGYIGGSALDTILTAHPDYEVTVLVRNDSKAEKLKATYPKVTTVKGDLDSANVIEAEAAKADIILHFADCDHVPSAKAFAKALSARSDTVYFIHTSGAALLPDIKKPELFGKPPQEAEHYSDVASLKTITSLPEDGRHLHRDVDSVVLGMSGNVNTAIVCPPTIYGPGTGTGNNRSNQIPELTRLSISRGQSFQVNEGKNVWNNVHVADLSDLYLLLTEAAASGGGKADWKDQGYYFAENGLHVWGEISAVLGKKLKAKGLAKTEEVESLSPEEIVKFSPFGAVLWGTNSSGKADRARKLGWVPKGESLVDTLDAVIESEARSLGKA